MTYGTDICQVKTRSPLGRTRTSDADLRRVSLYPLSYKGKGKSTVTKNSDGLETKSEAGEREILKPARLHPIFNYNRAQI